MVGGDALDLHLVEGPQHAPAGGLAVGAPDDELADEVVVELADLVAGLVAAVPADAEALGHASLVMRPGEGRNAPPAGSSALMRHSMAWPRRSTSSWVNDSGSPDGDAELLGDEVDAA